MQEKASLRRLYAPFYPESAPTILHCHSTASTTGGTKEEKIEYGFLSSEQGSGKSTFLRKLERLIDPKTIDLPGLPHDKDGLELRLSNSYFVALDNLSYISRKSGACYCIVRDYTRGGERKREYQVLPQGTTKAQVEKIRCQMELEAEFGA